MPSKRPDAPSSPTVLYFANTDWYLYNFRLSLAKAARAHGARVILVSPPGPYAEKLVREGFRWIPVSMHRRSLNPARELLVVYQLTQIYRQQRPDIAHHFTVKCVVYGGIAAKLSAAHAIAALAGMGYIYSARSISTAFLRRFVSLLFRFVGGSRSRTIVQNAEDRATAIRAGLASPDRIHLIAGSGVNTTRYQPRKGANTLPFTVVFVARLLWQKGIREFVEAAELVRVLHPEVRFVVAGEPDVGNPASVSVSDIENWKSLGNAVFVGHVEDTAEFFRAAHVAVLPTTYGEGVPRSLVEAAASGLALVATDHPGCREIVKHDVNGYLVPPRSPLAIAEAILHIYKDTSIRRRMALASRTIAVECFDERRIIDRTFAVYRELFPEW